MTTSRKIISLGPEFAVKVSGTREQEFEVTNLHDETFDYLKCEILNSTSWSPPKVFVTDYINKIIKIKFTDSRIPETTSLLLSVQGVVTQKIEVVENKVLLDGAKTKEAVKDGVGEMWKYIKAMFLAFILGSILLYFVKGTTFGNFVIDMWSNVNAGRVIQIADELDPRILTNKHPVYETAAFTELNAQYKNDLGDKKNLSKLYSFVGNGFFVTNDLITDAKGDFLKLSNPDAENYCSLIGGRLLEISELQAYLAGKYLTIENFIWPVSLRAKISEWSSSNVSWDNYWVYVKSSLEDIGEFENVKLLANNYKMIEFDDDEEFAFRCGFSANLYMSAK